MSPEAAVLIAASFLVPFAFLIAFLATETHTVGSTTDQQQNEEARSKNSGNTQEIITED